MLALLALASLQGSSTLLVDLQLSSPAAPQDGNVQPLGVAADRLWLSGTQEGQLSRLWSLQSGASEPEPFPVFGTDLSDGPGEGPYQVVDLASDVTLMASTAAVSSLSRIVPDTGATTPLAFGIQGRVTVVANKGYFFLEADGSSALWETDGTALGTRPLLTLEGEPLLDAPVPLGNQLLFVDRIGQVDFLEAHTLGSMDSTTLTTVPVSLLSFYFFPLEFEPVPGGLVFPARTSPADPNDVGQELWFTDGTAIGTGLLADINPGPASSAPVLMGSAGGLAYFSALTPAEGRELWVTDGTAAGTRLVRQLAPGSAPGLSVAEGNSGVLGDRLVFAGTAPQAAQELFISDGTAAGTVLLASILPGDEGSIPNSFQEVSGGSVFSAKTADGREPWFTDGVSTFPLGDAEPGSNSSAPRDFVEFNGTIYFSADTETTGRELWSAQPAQDTAQLAADIGAEPLTPSSSPRELLRVADRGFFLTEAPSGASLLWITDGTASGTELIDGAGTLRILGAYRTGVLYVALEEFGPSQLRFFEAGAASPNLLAASTFFENASEKFGEATVQLGALAYVPIRTEEEGMELWSTDGTFAGTQLAFDCAPGPQSGMEGIEEFVVVDDVAYFKRLRPGFATFEQPLRTDGTLAGTALLAPAQFNNHTIEDIERLGDEQVAIATVSTVSGVDQHELWSSDGTPAGTALRDIQDTPLLADEGDRLGRLSDLVLYRSQPAPDAQARLSTLDPDGAIQVVFAPGSDRDVVYSGASGYFLTRDTQTGETDLWVTEGQPASATRLAPAISQARLIGSGTEALFTTPDSLAGAESWITDGSPAGTDLFVDSAPGPVSSSPIPLGRVGNQFLFSAFTPEHGRELHAIELVAAGGFAAEPFGQGCALGSDRPDLDVNGEVRLGSVVTFDVADTSSFAPVFFYASALAVSAPLDGCTAYITAPVLFSSTVTNAEGSASQPFALTGPPSFAGLELYLQAAALVPAGPVQGTLELTSAVEVVIGL